MANKEVSYTHTPKVGINASWTQRNTSVNSCIISLKTSL